MIDKYALNKLKKKWPHIIVNEVKSLDLFDLTNKSRLSSNIAKDLYILDLQPLICQIICSDVYSSWPRWCTLKKPLNASSVHLIVVDGFSDFILSECITKYGQSKHFKQYFELINNKLDRSVRFINPISYGLSWKCELFEIPMSFLHKRLNQMGVNVNDENKLTKSLKRKNMNNSHVDDISVLKRKLELDENMQLDKITKNEKRTDAFSRTQLLLNLEQMEKEFIPRKYTNVSRWSNFKYSVPNGYKPVSDSSPIFAIDCEMVECNINSKVTKSLASVSIIDENRKTIYHKYVKPANLIVNYLTTYSGITPQIMENTSTSLEMVQNDLAKIITPDSILIGHSIGNDLEALELFHPYLIDTAIIYNLKGLRVLKPKLKDLCLVFLNRVIQSHKALGHDSLEDALATMDLVLLKLSKTLEFGDATVEEGDVERNCESVSNNQSILGVINHTDIHLRDKNLIENCKNIGESINLLSSVLPSSKGIFSQNVVCTLNEMGGFTKQWFPKKFHKMIMNSEKNCLKKKSSNNKEKRIHPFQISEVSCKSLKNNDLPSKKWITALFKKVIEEFDNSPVQSLCLLVFTDGACENGSESFGRIYFGFNTPIVKFQDK